MKTFKDKIEAIEFIVLVFSALLLASFFLMGVAVVASFVYVHAIL